MNKKLTIPFLVGSCLVMSIAVGNPVNEEGQSFASTTAKPVSGSQITVSPEESVPNYQGTNIEETKFQNDPGNMQTEAVLRTNQEESTSFVQERFYEAPRIILDPKTDGLIQQGEEIAENPQNIVSGFGGNYSGCSTLQIPCEQEFETRSCKESIFTRTNECESFESVEIVQDPPVVQDLSIELGAFTQNHVDFVIDFTGNTLNSSETWEQQNGVHWLSGNVPYEAPIVLSISEPLRNEFIGQDCANVLEIYKGATKLNDIHRLDPGPYLGVQPTITGGSGASINIGNMPGYPEIYLWLYEMAVAAQDPYQLFGIPNLQTLQFPSCENNYVGRYRIWKSPGMVLGIYRLNFQYRIDYPPRPIVTTIDNCTVFDQQVLTGQCKQLEATCVEPGEIRSMQGIQVYSPCWRTKKTYECFYALSENSCEALREQSCEQVDSKCINMTVGGVCAEFEQTMECPLNQCEAVEQVLCGEELYCIDGSCNNTAREVSENVNDSIIKLALIENMSKEYSEGDMQFFKGKYGFCTTAAGLYDCCQNAGWFTSVGLKECEPNDVEVGQAKQTGRNHFVGYECMRKAFWGECLHEKEVHCLFSSTLSRVFQEQGRIQIGRTWGSTQNPDCSGFTADELAQLDFGKMDLSEAAASVLATVQNIDTTKIQERVEEAVQRMGISK